MPPFGDFYSGPALGFDYLGLFPEPLHKIVEFGDRELHLVLEKSAKYCKGDIMEYIQASEGHGYEILYIILSRAGHPLLNQTPFATTNTFEKQRRDEKLLPFVGRCLQHLEALQIKHNYTDDSDFDKVDWITSNMRNRDQEAYLKKKILEDFQKGETVYYTSKVNIAHRLETLLYKERDSPYCGSDPTTGPPLTETSGSSKHNSSNRFSKFDRSKLSSPTKRSNLLFNEHVHVLSTDVDGSDVTIPDADWSSISAELVHAVKDAYRSDPQNFQKSYEHMSCFNCGDKHKNPAKCRGLKDFVRKREIIKQHPELEKILLNEVSKHVIHSIQAVQRHRGLETGEGGSDSDDDGHDESFHDAQDDGSDF